MTHVRAYLAEDIPAMIDIWNEVVEDGIAFPQEDALDLQSGTAFFAEQTHCGVAIDGGEVIGLYILHPNNIGRCSHTANASYCMDKRFRGMHIGRPLVERSLTEAKQLGFKGMQFNAVVTENLPALHIYYAVGFEKVGTIPGGFLLKDGRYCDMLILYRPL